MVPRGCDGFWPWRSLAVACLLSSLASGSNASLDPHRRDNPKSALPHPLLVDHRLRGPPASLKCDKDSVEGSGRLQSVHVIWAGVSFAKPGDWIGMWSASAINVTSLNAPIKFKYLKRTSRHCYRYTAHKTCIADAACQWSSQSLCVPERPSESGNVSFQVPNLRTDIFFAYISGDSVYPVRLATSSVVRVLKPFAPRGVHLALGDTPDSMHIYWQAGGRPQAPGVRFRRADGGDRSGDALAEGRAMPGRQYTTKELCDHGSEPASGQGWLQPGALLEAELTGLEPGARYVYSFGDEATGWSTERSFTAAPAGDAHRETVVAIFGDLGQAPPDGASQHSWDFENRGELPSRNTTDRLAADTSLELALHIGDISYSVGYLCEWDNFFDQIEPFAERRPWMTAIGNHEQGYSGSFYPSSDSGGECGVVYNAHFPFASQDPRSETPFAQRRPWYSFRFGNVAFVQMSTEHNFTKGSEQHRWLRAALAAVDRSKTPWLVFSGHRPMYVASSWQGDLDTAETLQSEVEPLLLEFGVDLALWGHFHAYQRFCRSRGGVCSADGVQHLLIGMAGYDHSQCPEDLPKIATICDDKHWGYLRLRFRGAAALATEFVEGASGAVLDSFEVPPRRRSLPAFYE